MEDHHTFRALVNQVFRQLFLFFDQICFLYFTFIKVYVLGEFFQEIPVHLALSDSDELELVDVSPCDAPQVLDALFFLLLIHIGKLFLLLLDFLLLVLLQYC